MSNYISKVTIPDQSGNTTYDVREIFPHVGTCADSAATATKTVTIGNFKLYTGAWVVVKFMNTNTAATNALLLNVDNTGAKAIKYKNANLDSPDQLAANKYVYFMYDGTYYQIIDAMGFLPLSGGTLTGRVTTTKPINDIITGTGTAAQDKGSGVSPRYFPAKWTYNTGMTATNGDIITIKTPNGGSDYGVFISIDNGTTYYPISTASTSRLSTHFGTNTYLSLIFRSDGQTNSVFPVAGGDSRVNVSGGCWYVINYYDSNTYDRTYMQTRIYAGGVGTFQYSLCAINNNQRMESFTTTSGTGTSKAFNTTAKFLYPPVIMYHSSSSNISNGSVISVSTLYEQFPSLDLRYSCNITSSAGFTKYKPVYLECIINSDNTFSPTGNGLTQTLTTGKYYILLGCTYNDSIYQLTLFAQHPVYYYDGTNLSQIQFTADEKTKLAGIAEGATKVESSSTNGKIKINGTDTTVYTHPSGFTAKTTAGFYKYTVDGNGHVSAGAAFSADDIPAHSHPYVPLVTGSGLAFCSGNGSNTWYQLATITITSSYINHPVVFEMSGRGHLFSRLEVMFNNVNSVDPGLAHFITDGYTGYYIKKTATSTWVIYGSYTESYGYECIHRITGHGAGVVTVTVDMINYGTTAPTDTTQAVYGWHAATANKLNSNAGSTTQPIYFSNGVPVATTYALNKTVPSDAVFTDTKVNVTLGTTTKAYLLGTSTIPTATAQAVESIADTGVYLGSTAGSLYATSLYGDVTFTSFGNGIADASRYVFFKDNSVNKLVKSENFKYNPSTNILSVGSITGTSSGWTNGRTLTIGSTGKTVDGTGDVSWSLSEIGAAPAVEGGYLPLSGGTLTGRVTTKKALNYILTGTGTAGADKGSGQNPRYVPARWIFDTGQTPSDGDVIFVRNPVAGHDYGVYISIDNGTTFYPATIRDTARLTTHYGGAQKHQPINWVNKCF